jgi:hypothetical protein
VARQHYVAAGTTAVALALGLLVALLAFVPLFLGSSRTLVVAGHDTEVRPMFDSHVVVRTGPLIPDVRRPVDAPVGVELILGKTQEASLQSLLQRYAFIGAHPEAQVAKVEDAVQDMALAAALRALALGVLPAGVWLLLGARRRSELRAAVNTRGGAVVGVALVVALPLLVVQPWAGEPTTEDDARSWLAIEEWLGLPVPAEAANLEVRTGPTSRQARKLVQGAVGLYRQSLTFYERATEEAATIPVRVPGEDETVVLLVADRHDNIGMDPVARAVADRAGATAVFDAGDDTSSGQPWEAFSLDSLQRAFDDLPRWSVAGNHDHGDFVADYLDDLGWTVLDGEVVEGPGGTTLLGVDDPRGTGLTGWRDVDGPTFAEVGQELADTACAHRDETGERVDTILVHHHVLATEALVRGCVRLVVAGHLHTQLGPIRVTGVDGSVGHHWTNGTTGGAAYMIAIGSTPRRDASMSLVTYRDGSPVGLQEVVLRTDGRFRVGEWYDLEEEAAERVGEP